LTGYRGRNKGKKGNNLGGGKKNGAYQAGRRKAVGGLHAAVNESWGPAVARKRDSLAGKKKLRRGSSFWEKKGTRRLRGKIKFFWGGGQGSTCIKCNENKAVNRGERLCEVSQS